MPKPQVGTVVHYIPMSDQELRCKTCDQPRAAIITRVHNDQDVDLLVFTTKADNACRIRTVVPYALVTDKAPHWRWIGDSMGEQKTTVTAQMSLANEHAPRILDLWAQRPLQDVLRSLTHGRGTRDRLLLERWAKALEGHLVDTSVVFDVDKDGNVRVGVTTEEGTVLEDDSHVTPQGEQA